MPPHSEESEEKRAETTEQVTSMVVKATDEEDVATDMRVAKRKNSKPAKLAKTGTTSATSKTAVTAGKVVKKPKRTGPLAVTS